jgi:hypothetical protein
MSLFRSLSAILAIILLAAPGARAAEEWLHDPLDDARWWLFADGTLAFEPVPEEFGANAPGRHWLRREDDAPAHVVYFVPGLVRGLEIDSHRRLGATGDFEVWLSADGRSYRRWEVTAQPLETVDEWEFRLIEEPELPPGYSHVLVRFPDAATAQTHRLSEVWIRFLWIEAAASEPTAPLAQTPLIRPAPVAVDAAPAAPATAAETTVAPPGQESGPEAAPAPAAAASPENAEAEVEFAEGPEAAPDGAHEPGPAIVPPGDPPAAPNAAEFAPGEPAPAETPRRVVWRKKIGPRSK